MYKVQITDWAYIALKHGDGLIYFILKKDGLIVFFFFFFLNGVELRALKHGYWLIAFK